MTENEHPRGDDAETDFGFASIKKADKQGLVNDVFAQVATRYDLMNDLMSGGLHRAWKDAAVAWLAPPRHDGAYAHLDVAGGTGDIAARVLKVAGAGARSIVCDISGEMLAVGRERMAPGDLDRLVFLQANAEALPLPPASIDAYTVAFGIRNMTELGAVLGEAHRVLKPGGRFLCLEFSEVEMPVLDELYDRYSFKAIPILGALVTGEAAPYRYLVESIRQFPNQERFAAMIAAAGFEQVKFRNLSGGIAAIHSGWKL